MNPSPRKDAYVMRLQMKMVIMKEKSRQLDMKKTQEVKPIAPTVISLTKHSPKQLGLSSLYKIIPLR